MIFKFLFIPNKYVFAWKQIFVSIISLNVPISGLQLVIVTLLLPINLNPDIICPLRHKFTGLVGFIVLTDVTVISPERYTYNSPDVSEVPVNIFIKLSTFESAAESIFEYEKASAWVAISVCRHALPLATPHILCSCSSKLAITA